MGMALRILLLVLTFALAPLAPARGNVTNDGRYAITYDLADQPVSRLPPLAVCPVAAGSQYHAR